MKNKHSTQKFLLIIISAIMLFSIFSISAFAADDDAQEQGVTVWELSDDGKTLTGNDIVYTQIDIPAGYHVDFSTEYIYASEIETKLFKNGSCYPVSPQKNSKVVCLVNNYENTYYTYVTYKEKSSLQNFYNNIVSKFRIQNPNDSMEYTDFPEYMILHLDNLARANEQNVNFDVSALKDHLYVEFIARNQSDYMSMTFGGIYKIDYDYYYVNYTKLNNGYFDANGDFSYRSGTVSLTKIDSDLLKDIKDFENAMTKHSYESEYEEDEIDVTFDKTTAKVLFWIIFVIFGFLVPIAPLIVGFTFALSEKRGYPKHWYLVAFLSLAWMALSLILAIILIFG